MRIAVLGAGSLGTIIGAFIANDGDQTVELIDVNEAHVDELNKSGAKIVGTTELIAPVRAITPKEMSGTYDLVLLLTKQMFNQSALRHLLPFLGEKSVVCSLQNGVPEENVVSVIGSERVVGGSVEFGATWVEPGVSRLTTEFHKVKENAFQIGELDGTITERILNIKAVLDFVGNTTVSDNLMGTKWSKLTINVALSGMSAALGCTFGDVLNNEFGVISAAHLADETIKVAHAKGIILSPMSGFDISSLEINNESEIQHRINQLRYILKPQALLKASMLQDLEKSKITEIDYINGIIPQYAKGIGLSTPYNDLVIKLVKQAEQTKFIPNFETNIRFFKGLIEKL
jgi:2-dehydropantoate 2-reductase